MFNAARRPAAAAAPRNESNTRAMNGAPPPMQELGAMLRKRREAMGASLAEVETATKIRQKYLAAIEADEWQLLPGEVVGRGFLRNYATYLGLDATELIERRRAVVDPSLAVALSDTSAGSALPPQRTVDYRPKDVPLMEESDGIEQRREIRWTPLLAVAGMVLLLLLLIWVVRSFGSQISNSVTNLARSAQTRIAEGRSAPTATATALLVAQGGGNMENSGAGVTTPVATNAANGAGVTSSVMPTVTENSVAILPTPTATAPEPANTPESATPESAVAPTETPTPTAPPTDTPLPTDTPTETPAETPTEEATPQPAVSPPFCEDPRARLFTPGENQVVSGDVAVSGTAIHESFQAYKLEFAPGAGASEGFVYFAGGTSAVDGGLLGTFSSSSVPNGAYTLQLTVVDQTGNYPPPCKVSILVQN